ncbi:MAG: HD domain-containing protein [Desulfuromonadales bacterium]|nr:HD domain-containing protein [Desulfuromonadales bacterium]
MDALLYIESQLLLTDSSGREAAFRNDPRLRALLPEVYRLAGVPQSPEYHPEGDVLTHTLLAVRHLPAGCDRRLAWAALLHDIGKATTTREIGGRWRAFGHDRVGADLAEERLHHLGMAEAERLDIQWLIRHHMFALSWQVDEQRQLSRRQWRFIGDRRFPLLLALMEVDALAAAASPDKLGRLDFYRQAWKSLAEKNC